MTKKPVKAPNTTAQKVNNQNADAASQKTNNQGMNDSIQNCNTRKEEHHKHGHLS